MCEYYRNVLIDSHELPPSVPRILDFKQIRDNICVPPQNMKAEEKLYISKLQWFRVSEIYGILKQNIHEEEIIKMMQEYELTGRDLYSFFRLLNPSNILGK